MELSLFSRDLIAMSTAVALSHNMFDGALTSDLRQDRAWPFYRCAHLRHCLRCCARRAHAIGLPNKEKARIRHCSQRERSAGGIVEIGVGFISQSGHIYFTALPTATR